jgi:RNA polymerase sigma factor for flagellar operon FliA
MERDSSTAASKWQSPDSDHLWAEFMRSRDARARNELIERYMPLARYTAARLFRMRADESVGFDDYLQYARLGLLEAVDRYDPAREASFETFSTYRIRGAILNGLGKESELAAQRSYWRTRTQERMDSLRPGALQGSESDLEGFVHLTVGMALGFLLDDSEEVPDESERSNPYAATAVAQLRRVVRLAVDRLPPRERDLICRHYFGELEFQAVASDLGITKGRVSQLHSQALLRIREFLGAELEVDV